MSYFYLYLLLILLLISSTEEEPLTRDASTQKVADREEEKEEHTPKQTGCSDKHYR